MDTREQHRSLGFWRGRRGGIAHVAAALMFVAPAMLSIVTPAVAQTATATNAPSADIWLDNGATLLPGAVARVHYRADPGSYVAVVRLDGDGNLSILVPSLPNVRSKISSTADRLVTFRGETAEGVGELFVIASRSPFDFTDYKGSDGRWRFAARTDPRSDAEAIITRFARRITNGRAYWLAAAEYEISSTAQQSVAVQATPDPVGAVIGGYGYDYNTVYDDPYLWDVPYGYYWRNGSSYYWDGYAYSPIVIVDGRTRYTRHCADGTLVPYGQPCPASNANTGGPRPRAPHLRPRAPTPPRIMPPPGQRLGTTPQRQPARSQGRVVTPVPIPPVMRTPAPAIARPIMPPPPAPKPAPMRVTPRPAPRPTPPPPPPPKPSTEPSQKKST